MSISKITVSNPNNAPVLRRCLLSIAVASSVLLVGCGDDNETTVTYAPTSQPIATFSASAINQQVQAASISGAPNAACGVSVEKVSYRTKGSAGEDTNATAALMLPSGDNAECKGERPVLLYAHGTTTEKVYDFSQLGNAQNPAVAEATLIAANFAAQGYIVIAPNYAGYDKSTLAYHPYLVAEQQSTDMVDALNNSRSIIKEQRRTNNTNDSNVSDSGKLFLSGYSQGGHVVMATARRLEQQNKPITAIAPSSGPYALAAFGDAIFAGNVNIGATAFAPLLAAGLQEAYKNIYESPTDIFRPQYADTKLPNALSLRDLIITGKLPQTAMFQASEAETGFGFAADNYLVQTSFREAYLADVQLNPDSLLAKTGLLPAENPQNTLRKALKINDLRSYAPEIPTFLCGGNQDPTVFYDLNTGSMAAILQAKSIQTPTSALNVTVFDVDATNSAGRESQSKSNLTIIGQASMNQWNVNTVLDAAKTNFEANANAVKANAPQLGLSPEDAFISFYHGSLVSNACTNATREFFNQTFAQS